jgi:hypothetical protein
VSHTWPEPDRRKLDKYIVTRLLPAYAEHQDKHFAEDMLAQLARSLKGHPDIAPEYTRLALSHIHDTWCERYGGNRPSSDRSLIWRTLLQVPIHVVTRHSETMQQIALDKIEHDPLEAKVDPIGKTTAGRI